MVQQQQKIEKQEKGCQILICSLMEEMMLSDL